MCQTGQCAQCQNSYLGAANQQNAAYQAALGACQVAGNINIASQQLAANQFTSQQTLAANQQAYMGQMSAAQQQQTLDPFSYKQFSNWCPILQLLYDSGIDLDTPEKVAEMKEMMARLIKMKAFW